MPTLLRAVSSLRRRRGGAGTPHSAKLLACRALMCPNHLEISPSLPIIQAAWQTGKISDGAAPQRVSPEKQMIDLEPLKRCLRVSPTLYRNVYKLYRATPFGRTRAAQMHRESTELLHVRLESESRLIKESLNDDWTVRHGPFAGMRYAAVASGSLLSPKVIGSYEKPIHSWVM